MTVEIKHEQTTFLTKVDDLQGALKVPDKLEELLKRVEAQADAMLKAAPDVDTDAGRKARRSIGRKVASSKGAIDDARKKAGEDLRTQLADINTVGNAAVARLQALQDRIIEPVEEWDRKEEERLDALRVRLAELTPAPVAGAHSDVIKAEIERIKAIKIDGTWEDFQATAAEARKNALKALKAELDIAQQREEDQAEIRRLKEAIAARDAAEAERVAAERKKAEEAEAARREEERKAEEAKRLEEAAARAAEEAREAAEREAQEKIDAANRAAEEAAEREREAKEAREAAEKAAEEAAAKAIEDERKRVAEERRQEREAEAKRRADAARRSRIKEEIAAVVLRIGNISGPEGVAEAILNDEVPHVRAVL